MADPESVSLTIGSGAEQRDIAVLRRDGNAPGVFWVGGYRSEMVGAKATALDALAAAEGLAVTRFDYSGHGQSGGDFLDGSISRWLDEALAVFSTTSGPQIVVGSSMGGWIALLLARRAPPGRVKALVLIAPAVDMTEELMRKKFTRKERTAMALHGRIDQPSEESAGPYPITARLLDDGASHLLFGKGIETGCPVTILQGGRDSDVPKEHALKLVQHLLTDPVTFTLIPDGDHRLSREEDLRVLEAAVLRAVAESP